MIVYLVTNQINGKQYVGQTVKTLKLRWTHHINAVSFGSMCYIHKALRKYGKENFSIKILHECENREELSFVEMFYIALLNTKSPNGYNLTDGGEGAIGFKHSEVTKTLLRTLGTGRKASEETRKKIRENSSGRNNGRFGKAVSEQTRRKMSKALKGMVAWNKGLKGVQKSTRKGVQMPLETRAKMSEAKKLKPSGPRGADGRYIKNGG